jgi:hypothetical protein
VYKSRGGDRKSTSDKVGAVHCIKIAYSLPIAVMLSTLVKAKVKAIMSISHCQLVLATLDI